MSEAYLTLRELSAVSRLSVPTLRTMIRAGMRHQRTRGASGKILVKIGWFEEWTRPRERKLEGIARDVIEFGEKILRSA